MLLNNVNNGPTYSRLRIARCGKNYMASQPIVPPGGEFPIPEASSDPLLAFRCAPAVKPYLPEDMSTTAGIIIDTPITYSRISGASPITFPQRGPLGTLSVTVGLNGRTLTQGHVPLNASKFVLPFHLDGLQPQLEPFNLTCTASFALEGGHTQNFETSAALSFLPDPPDGRSVTKMDLRTGALLAKPATGAPGDYETVFPIGFYTNFGGYIASNLSLLDEIKADG